MRRTADSAMSRRDRGTRERSTSGRFVFASTACISLAIRHQYVEDGFGYAVA